MSNVSLEPRKVVIATVMVCICTKVRSLDWPALKAEGHHPIQRCTAAMPVSLPFRPSAHMFLAFDCASQFAGPFSPCQFGAPMIFQAPSLRLRVPSCTLAAI